MSPNEKKRLNDLSIYFLIKRLTKFLCSTKKYLKKTWDIEKQFRIAFQRHTQLAVTVDGLTHLHSFRDS